MQVRVCGAGILLLLSSSLAGCTLVTVPVNAVGSLAETVVTTTGDVVTAPFGGGEAAKESVAKEPAKAAGVEGADAEK